MNNTAINTIIFDLGGVLIDWNPRYLYRKIFKTEDEITWFLENICTSDWNEEQDAGRSFEDATAALIRQHPTWEIPIRAWYDRWQETVTGSIPETVEMLRYFKDNSSHRLYALTNWSDQTFPWAFDTFDFMKWFDGIVVSGVEKTRKPFPEFYQIMFDRYKINPAQALFIDDNFRNIEGAKAVGLQTIHFQTPAQVRAELQKLELLPAQ